MAAIYIYKVLSALISYPTPELQAARADLLDALSEDTCLSRVQRQALCGLVEELAGDDLLDAQARYVDLFDRSRSLSLHLFEHVHGESRDRGQAMVSLRDRYRQAGVDIGSNELPDYLPLFLEFLSLLSEAEARASLSETAHILEALAGRLRSRGSRYAAVFDALVALCAENRAAGALCTADEAQDLEAIDKVWEEAEVRFGPGDAQTDGCPRASSILANVIAETRTATP